MNADQLVKKAIEARDFAYAPYSKFKVGAAILTTNQKVYSGCNVENASYGLTNCAERTAIFKAVSEGESKVEAIAIVADTDGPVSPCGACRQVIAEFCHEKTQIILANLKGDVEVTTIDRLLPGFFASSDLNK
ncbi:cytidine deaminase [Bacillus sp. RG28]|uniref:Cytidine deaminase n=1 Tax=Gottfriedia endophytica TaxID=2820819 RepID=A0A940SJ32_9BACI|nr:cytidine deaminase [Gottfriedia endophytica]MBP0725056.1 cytidine deaminase [Gottfriedia endophytica]